MGKRERGMDEQAVCIKEEEELTRLQMQLYNYAIIIV